MFLKGFVLQKDLILWIAIYLLVVCVGNAKISNNTGHFDVELTLNFNCPVFCVYLSELGNCIALSFTYIRNHGCNATCTGYM